jgi:signal transduction histidine kinase
MVPGMLASGIALNAISKPDEPRLGRRFVSAVLMGGGIAAMHYSGMAAMRPQALLRYDPELVAVSIVVAVVLAFVSLSIRFHRPQSSNLAATIIAASVMGCAVAGMHYTAMQASIFFPLPDAPAYSMAFSPMLLALLITIFAVLIAISTLVAAFAGRQNELALSLRAEVARRRRIEADLRRSETYLAEAQRLSHTGSWAFNVTTRQFTHSSEEHHRLLSFEPGARMLVWEDWARRLHPEDRESTVGTIEQSIRERTDFELDYRIVHPDGTSKYIHASGHPVLNASGAVVEFVGTSIDMTELRRAEEARLDAQVKLSHANRVTTMGQLAASIAHEVKQPIAAKLTNAQAGLRWLDRRPPDLEEVRQVLARIVKDGDRAAEIIDDVRALIKKAPPRNDPLEINGTVREVIGLTWGEAVKNDVSVRTELADGLPSVQGDRVQLQQVILNLIINAFEAMSSIDEGPRELLISTGKVEQDGVFVSVRDTGPGLAPATAERLFESFHTTKPGGLGLGLSICRSIVEGHGGRLWAGVNEPRGAVFQFTVPGHPDSVTAAQSVPLGESGSADQMVAMRQASWPGRPLTLK